MAQKINLLEIVKQAKGRGYFDFADFPGLILSFAQLKELNALLERKRIPFGTVSGVTALTRQEALQIVNSLRKGTPPSADVSTFSVGRKNLIDGLNKDLEAVTQASSRVRFMNADYGCGKTHALYLLREIAFKQEFVVSIVTLNQDSCPIHDFMAMYRRIMWNLRTEEERNKPAIESVLDRWLDAIHQSGEERARQIIRMLPDDLKSALHAYYESTSPLKPNEEKRLLVLRFLSGETIYLRELRQIGVQHHIDSSNALSMLGYMASLFRNLRYHGICILFDEAESIHSFARGEHQDQAYSNLFQIVRQSQSTSRCLFLYATTPSFFDNYSYYWPSQHRINDNDILELERLEAPELRRLASNLCKIYSTAYGIEVPEDVEQVMRKIGEASVSERIGDFTRRCIAILDEKRK